MQKSSFLIGVIAVRIGPAFEKIKNQTVPMVQGYFKSNQTVEPLKPNQTKPNQTVESGLF